MVPMRRAHREITDPTKLREVIDECTCVRIGASDEHGPFVVPMSFGYEWSSVDFATLRDRELHREPTSPIAREAEVDHPVPLRLYLHSATQGRKVACFDSSPRVAIEMDLELGVIEGPYACSFSYSYRSVMGSGIIRPLDDPAQKLRALELIMQHMAPDAKAPFTREAVERVRVYRVDVDQISGKERFPKEG